MYSTFKWIRKLTYTASVTFVFASAAPAQTRIFIQGNSFLAPDEARDIYNAGRNLFDEYRFTDAENKFREVVRRFPKNPIADRADYYLIRTLMQAGKTNEALSRIDAFSKQHPRSTWLDDVQELRIQLTNQVPPKAETILLRTPPFPPQRPVTPFPAAVQIVTPPTPPTAQTPATPVTPPTPPAPPTPPTPFISPFPAPFGPTGYQSSDPDISLQQEVLRALFYNNADHAIQIATERLKANPADPVALSSLHLVASSRSAQALPMLLEIVKNSSNPKARRDAIFWLGQSRGDKDAVVDTLVGLLPSLAEDDSEAVTYTLSQIRSDKSLNALATIARDKNKTEKVRNNAVFWIGQSRAANRVGVLEDVYKNSMDNLKIRQQVLFALSQTRDPQAVTIIGNAASSDPDIEVRKQAVFWLGRNRSPEANQLLEKLLQKK